MLLSSPEGAFATGAAGYLDAHPEIREPLPRIYVRFSPEGTEHSFLALLDTGGHYGILNHDVIAEIREHLGASMGSIELRTARGLVRGNLHRLHLTLLADHGDHLEVDATVFISQEWHGPNFLGYTGVLDRARFALDPWRNRIYFGPPPSGI